LTAASPTDWNYWPFDPGIVLGLLALVAAYVLAATRYRAALLRPDRKSVV